jgi:hypothetical protein
MRWSLERERLESAITVDLARRLALTVTVGTVLSALGQLLWVCSRCFPAATVSLPFRPLAWPGLAVAGIFIWLGRMVSGSGLALQVTRRSLFFLGLNLLLTSTVVLTSSPSSTNALYFLLTGVNFMLFLFSLRAFWSTGSLQLEPAELWARLPPQDFAGHLAGGHDGPPVLHGGGHGEAQGRQEVTRARRRCRTLTAGAGPIGSQRDGRQRGSCAFCAVSRSTAWRASSERVLDADPVARGVSRRRLGAAEEWPADEREDETERSYILGSHRRSQVSSNVTSSTGRRRVAP